MCAQSPDPERYTEIRKRQGAAATIFIEESSRRASPAGTEVKSVRNGRAQITTPLAGYKRGGVALQRPHRSLRVRHGQQPRGAPPAQALLHRHRSARSPWRWRPRAGVPAAPVFQGRAVKVRDPRWARQEAVRQAQDRQAARPAARCRFARCASAPDRMSGHDSVTAAFRQHLQLRLRLRHARAGARIYNRLTVTPAGADPRRRWPAERRSAGRQRPAQNLG